MCTIYFPWYSCFENDDSCLIFLFVKSIESKAQKNRANRDGVRPQTADHAMVELEGMIDYCTKPGCRRKHVLQHFGEEFDANTQCNMTCDFCKVCVHLFRMWMNANKFTTFSFTSSHTDV